MNILSAVKNTAFSAAVTTTLNYLEQNPEQNIPKAMSLMDKVLPDGWYEGQWAAFRKAIEENPKILRDMVKRTGAKSTDLQSPESVDHLCEKCDSYAACWKGTADMLWQNSKKMT